MVFSLRSIMASNSDSPSCCAENVRDEQRSAFPRSYTEERTLEPRQQEYDFLEEPPPEYFCPVTFGVLHDPKQTECCGHHLSGSVVTRLQREGKPCPLCNDPNFTVISDKYFKRKMGELKVRCSYKRNGCTWEGELGNLDQHSKSCPKRPWQCQYCDFRGTYDIGTTDHFPNCTKYPEPCPNQCDIGTVPHCEMEKHLTECPLQLVECEFAQAGCRERIPRQDLSRHMEEGAQRHLLSMSLLNLSLTRELHQKMAEKDQQIAELQGQLQEQSRKLEGLQEQGKQTTKQLHGIETGFQCQQQELMDQQKVTENQISGIQTQLAEQQLQKIDDLQEQFQRETGNLQEQLALQLKVVEKGWQQQNRKLEDQLKVLGKQTEKQLQKQLETGLTGLQHQTKRLEEEIEVIGQQTEKQLRQFERKLTVQQSEMAQLLRENRVLQTTLQQQGDEMQSLVQEGHASVLGLYPTFEFTITKFSVRRTKRSRGLWESDPFYSHHRGYKFHLSIDTNGFQEAEGTHITADLYLHAGEYDYKLSWPFYITAHLQLLNQRGDHGHVVASLNTTVDKDDEYIEIARKFIAHSELRYNAMKNTQYLEKDCLDFRLYLKVTPQS